MHTERVNTLTSPVQPGFNILIMDPMKERRANRGSSKSWQGTNRLSAVKWFGRICMSKPCNSVLTLPV